MPRPDIRLERVRPLQLIIFVLSLWGLYLAAGATNLFTPNAAAFDLRKFFIVAACSAGFVIFWWASLRFSQRHNDNGDIRNPVSVSSVIALTLSLVAYGLWGWAHQVNDDLAMRIGLVSAVLFGCSMVAAMIGISDPIAKRMKRAGTISVFLFLLAIALFVVQIQIYVAK